MDIKRAKDQIKNAMTAYFTKDKNGEYMIPVEKQRPVFLVGPPGIGKTAIMEQIAAELNVGLLTYSMTHHTRQSALGLPFIKHKNYKGMEYDISEYTMSEIIASVYDCMERTGIEEGILFLDEINCVSETLAPIMLQFLQYKMFGRHRVPDGWIIVTAGNPPEFNNSVRDFDVVTWDRLKRIDVEPDYEVWKEYEYTQGAHPAVMSYLDIKKADFYKIETTVDGKAFVTARGWDDLSQMIKLYEMHGLKVDEDLVGQYIQDAKICKDFSAYYDLFVKYKGDYQIATILDGTVSDEIVDRAKEARFDERLSLLNLVLDSVNENIKEVVDEERILSELMASLKEYRVRLADEGKTPYEIMDELINDKVAALKAGRESLSLSRSAVARMTDLIELLGEEKKLIADEKEGKKAFMLLKKDFDARTKAVKEVAAKKGEILSNVFKFCENAFSDGQEMIILVTELTANSNTAQFIAKYGCDEYYKYNKELLIYERHQEISSEIDDLILDEQ